MKKGSRGGFAKARGTPPRPLPPGFSSHDKAAKNQDRNQQCTSNPSRCPRVIFPFFASLSPCTDHTRRHRAQKGGRRGCSHRHRPPRVRNQPGIPGHGPQDHGGSLKKGSRGGFAKARGTPPRPLPPGFSSHDKAAKNQDRNQQCTSNPSRCPRVIFPFFASLSPCTDHTRNGHDPFQPAGVLHRAPPRAHTEMWARRKSFRACSLQKRGLTARTSLIKVFLRVEQPLSGCREMPVAHEFEWSHDSRLSETS